MPLIFRYLFLFLSFTLLFSKSVGANQLGLELLNLEQNEEWNEKHVILKKLIENTNYTADREPLYLTGIKSLSPSKYVKNSVWGKLCNFMMPSDHPIKKKLDKIFSTSRALCDLQSMVAAGFAPAEPQHHTQIIVTKHPQLPGYIIKAYLDIQDYHSGKPEHYFWKKRIIGARLINDSIKDHKYGHLLKVPKKWIYLLPDEPSPPPNYLRKMFILVEEDMNIFDNQTNEALLGSPLVTTELLKALYTIITELGLFDCAKPANCPVSVDGRLAFVDTQSYYKKVKYHKLTPYLSPAMQSYWLKLIAEGEK